MPNNSHTTVAHTTQCILMSSTSDLTHLPIDSSGDLPATNFSATLNIFPVSIRGQTPRHAPVAGGPFHSAHRIHSTVRTDVVHDSSGGKIYSQVARQARNATTGAADGILQPVGAISMTNVCSLGIQLLTAVNSGTGIASVVRACTTNCASPPPPYSLPYLQQTSQLQRRCTLP